MQRIVELYTAVRQDELYKMCLYLDNNGDGNIQLDEFLRYFEHLDNTEEDQMKQEEIKSQVWPEWVVVEDKIPKAKDLLTKISEELESQKIDPMKAMSIFDKRNRGVITIEEFKRVLKTFSATDAEE